MAFKIINLDNGKEIYVSDENVKREISERIRHNLGALDETEMTGYSGDPDQIGGP